MSRDVFSALAAAPKDADLVLYVTKAGYSTFIRRKDVDIVAKSMNEGFLMFLVGAHAVGWSVWDSDAGRYITPADYKTSIRSAFS